MSLWFSQRQGGAGRESDALGTGERTATESKLYKTVELLISQVFYTQNCVYEIGIVNILLFFYQNGISTMELLIFSEFFNQSCVS